VSFGFLVAGLLATTNAGRVALARRAGRPTPGALALALMAGSGLIAAGAVLADGLLDALAISPESFRIAAGLVLAAAGLRTIVWPRPSGPFAAILVTPELACLAVSFGADEGMARVLGAAAIALPIVAIAALARPREPTGLAARFLASLQVVVAVALVVSGVRDV
jgi:small neutral amino acid transporter SnatA (MarC family)